MKSQDLAQIRALPTEELQIQLRDCEDKLFKLKFANAVSPLKNGLQIKHLRAHKARLLMTVLAVMLGVQRPTVSVVASGLQQEGLIRYRHGVVSVKSRRGLEEASCECYRLMRSRFSQLMQ